MNAQHNRETQATLRWTLPSRCRYRFLKPSRRFPSNEPAAATLFESGKPVFRSLEPYPSASSHALHRVTRCSTGWCNNTALCPVGVLAMECKFEKNSKYTQSRRHCGPGLLGGNGSNRIEETNRPNAESRLFSSSVWLYLLNSRGKQSMEGRKNASPKTKVHRCRKDKWAMRIVLALFIITQSHTAFCASPLCFCPSSVFAAHCRKRHKLTNRGVEIFQKSTGNSGRHARCIRTARNPGWITTWSQQEQRGTPCNENANVPWRVPRTIRRVCRRGLSHDSTSWPVWFSFSVPFESTVRALWPADSGCRFPHIQENALPPSKKAPRERRAGGGINFRV